MFWWWQSFSYTPPAISFDGDSSRLKDLADRANPGHADGSGQVSVLWCSSFQLAWNQLKNDIVHEPIRLQNAEAVADRLNRAEQSLDDISPESVYTAAGFNRDGIADRIRLEMRSRFPGAPIPELDGAEDVVTAFAHLAADIRFSHPFLVDPNPLNFVDARGRETKVASFGIPRSGGAPEVREQVRVLYATYAGEQALGFALDLSVKSQPNQLVLALVKPGATLAETLADLQTKMTTFQANLKANAEFKDDELHYNETIAIPTMHWRISHHFRELERRNKLLLNDCCRTLYMGTAYQDIEFCLDAKGATVASNARATPAASAEGECRKPRPTTAFIFIRPFLIYMKKRDAQHTFCVMWVNDAELLLAAKGE